MNIFRKRPASPPKEKVQLTIEMDKPNYCFIARFPDRYRVVPVQRGDMILMHCTGSSPWFNPTSPADLALMHRTEAPRFAETDTLIGLVLLQEAMFAPMNQTVVYQAFPEPEPGQQTRPIKTMFAEDSAKVAETLKGGPTRSLLIVSCGFQPGAIQTLGTALEGHELEFLGLCWYYSGDDITDQPGYPEEIASTCRRLNIKRLSLLTGAFNQAVDQALRKALSPGTNVKVFQKDDEATYPLLATY